MSGGVLTRVQFGVDVRVPRGPLGVNVRRPMFKSPRVMRESSY